MFTRLWHNFAFVIPHSAFSEADWPQVKALLADRVGRKVGSGLVHRGCKARITWLFCILCLATACTAADPHEREVTPAELSCASLEAGAGRWQTAPWPPPEAQAAPSCPWLDYAGRVTLRLPHPLGRVPAVVHIFLSFEADGRRAAPAAGDLSRIVAADANAVWLENRTNENFYARVVLE
ncbi:MAG: hypothetical protein ACPGUV_06115 [Polyangiales bacterium]